MSSLPNKAVCAICSEVRAPSFFDPDLKGFICHECVNHDLDAKLWLKQCDIRLRPPEDE